MMLSKVLRSLRTVRVSTPASASDSLACMHSWSPLCASSSSSSSSPWSAGLSASAASFSTDASTPDASSSSSSSSAQQVVQLPFLVPRTKSKNLPVYVQYYHGGNQVVTVVRKYKGDEAALATGLQAVVGPDVPLRVRPGRIEIKGDRKAAIEGWLQDIGY